MGTAESEAVPPIVEGGPVPVIFFSDFELEVFNGHCARFVLLQEQRPHYLDAPPERTIEVKLITSVHLLPGMIAKLIFELGRQWQREWMRSLRLPLQ